ncbi:MAG: hypothetical protein JWO02_3746 [Solirubrobacterales bacterium]|nr:hypothetical protein [Solirubrobacterales bacterium]
MRLRPSSGPTRHLRDTRRVGIAAIALLGVGWILIMQSLGWAQTSYFASVKALADGTTRIDDYHWETRDKSYIGGHFYSVKAPGLPLLLTPPYLALKAVGALTLAREAADTARRGGTTQWTYRGLKVAAYGYSRRRAATIKRRLEVQAPLIWALGLVGSVLPALALLVLLRRRAERLEPGFGTLTAVSLGTGTLVMPFAVELFGHMLAALLAFCAFLVVWDERRGGAPRPWRLAVGGLLAGLAVTTEYPLAIAGAVVGLYAVLRPGTLAAGWRATGGRALAYAAGVLAGIVPLLMYNVIAFGNVATLSYKDAVNEQGTTGHLTLGLNGNGFFGIGMPRARQAAELLISPRGLFVLTPIVLAAVIGTVLMYRRGHRAEALVVGAVCAGFYLYDTGYWLPMGGGSPGPRFLIPMLPFLALGLASAWRAIPGPTLALAAASATTMIIATISYPLVGAGGTHQWTYRIDLANFQPTLLSAFGLDNGWVAIAPVLIAFGLAMVLAVVATPALRLAGQRRLAWLTLAAWGVLAGVVAPWFGEEQIGGPKTEPTGFVDHRGQTTLVLVALATGALVLTVAGRRSAQAVDGDTAADGAPDTERSRRTSLPRRPARAGGAVGVEHHGLHPEAAQAGD